MVPYKTPRSDIPSTDDMAFECEIVTDMWLERCLDARALVPPEAHVASTPFPKFPIPGFSGMRICSTGFARIDLLHLSKLVDLMGASYDEYLTPKASVLICNDPQTASYDKLRHTSEWGVPAVSADWFWISVQTGRKKPFEPYIVRRPVSQSKSSREQLSGASANGKQTHPPAEKAREMPSKTSKEPATGQRTKSVVPGKRDKPRVIPIVGDGFADEEPAEAPQASVAESQSPSPARNTDAAPTEEPAKQSKPAASSALDTALKGLLQQAQAAKSRRQSESMTTEDSSYPQRRKRKPLLGRAPSHSSNRATELNRAASRASSIDTLNDDGLGSAVESAEPTRENSFSRTNSRNDQSLSSMFSGAKFDFLADRLPAQLDNEDEENQEPQMTQLDYEDPDAAAMRAEFLRNAGKLAGNPQRAHSDMLGEVRELEDVGWGHGRRTRKHVSKPTDDE